MPYTLRKTNGTTLAIIQDGAIETSTDLVFVGKNYAGYGQTVNENFLKLLENFAGPRIPESPVTGQVWFDTSTLKVKAFDGTRFKSLTFTEVDNKRPSDLRQGDQWFDPVDQKLYVYNGQDFIMIGPEKSAAALQSQIAGILVQDTVGSSYTVLQASIGSGQNSVSSVFSPEAFVPNANSSLATEQRISNVVRGISLPGTLPVTVSRANGTVVGAKPDRANPGWSLFGVASAAWGMVEYNEATTGPTAGDTTFYDAKSYIRRDEFSQFSGSITINNNDGLTVGVGEVVKLHVDSAWGNDVGNLTNPQSKKLNINIRAAANTVTNILSMDYGNGALLVIPNIQLNTSPSGTASPVNIPVDLGTDTNRFRAGYIKTLYASELNTSTNGIITGIWTLAAGAKIQGSGGSTIEATQAALATKADTLRSYDNINYVGAKIDSTALSVAQRDVEGYIVSKGITASGTGSKVRGTWIIDAGATFQATTLLGSNSAGYIASAVSAGNNTIVQRSSTGEINAGTVVTQNLKAGTLESSNGEITGQWTLVGTSTLEATYADLAERYEADAIYKPGTVMVIGGEKEVTKSTSRAHTSPAGIISTAPAFKMNYTAGTDETHPYVALKGRVPCKVVGPIEKGNRLVSSATPGHAEAWREGDSPNAVIAVALENWNGEPGVIEVMVK